MDWTGEYYIPMTFNAGYDFSSLAPSEPWPLLISEDVIKLGDIIHLYTQDTHAKAPKGIGIVGAQSSADDISTPAIPPNSERYYVALVKSIQKNAIVCRWFYRPEDVENIERRCLITSDGKRHVEFIIEPNEIFLSDVCDKNRYLSVYEKCFVVQGDDRDAGWQALSAVDEMLCQRLPARLTYLCRYWHAAGTNPPMFYPLRGKGIHLNLQTQLCDPPGLWRRTVSFSDSESIDISLKRRKYDAYEAGHSASPMNGVEANSKTLESPSLEHPAGDDADSTQAPNVIKLPVSIDQLCDNTSDDAPVAQATTSQNPRLSLLRDLYDARAIAHDLFARLSRELSSPDSYTYNLAWICGALDLFGATGDAVECAETLCSLDRASNDSQ